MTPAVTAASGVPQGLLYPVPRPEAVARAQELYFTKLGRRITEAEAREALTCLMRLLWIAATFPDPVPPGEENLTAVPPQT